MQSLETTVPFLVVILSKVKASFLNSIKKITSLKKTIFAFDLFIKLFLDMNRTLN